MRVAVYGEINLNLIDGSSVWLQSVAQTLTTLPWVEVTLLLRVPEKRDLITAPLREHPRIDLVDPPPHEGAEAITAEQAVNELERLDAERHFDLVLLRGWEVTEEACRRAAFPGRLWAYFLPLYRSAERGQADHLELLAGACERILCQTEPIRALAEAATPEHADKLILLPPMIRAAPEVPSPERSGALKLLYAGKFAPEYYFLEMVDAFRKLRRSLPDAELHLVGDKIHNPPDDPSFKTAAEAALTETPNVIWHGAVSREEVRELLGDVDVALSVRHPMMSRSLELSTKVLEYGAAGCAVLLNRTSLYEELLGSDYPFFARDPETGLASLLGVREDPSLRERAAARCMAAAQRFTFDRVAAELEPYLQRLRGAGSRAQTGGDSPHLVIAGHDFKFLARIPDRARAAGAEVREDRWSGHNEHSPLESEELLAWSDVVMCEWCLGNAVWYSQNVGRDRRLVIRFHRVERTTDYPAAVEIDRVDRVVFVGPHLRDEAIERYSWPAEKLRVVPNAVDLDALRREKLPGSSFNLGMVGYVPAIKRPDRALDLLELLRARDPRFRLILKGRPPWAYPWMGRREDELHYFQELYRRIEAAPLLRDAVSFEEFSPNIPAFLRKVGTIVSTSDYEGHQVGLAEGMASGCVPVVIDRPGARQQYSDRWVHSSPDEAAAALLGLFGEGTLEAEQRRAAEFAERWGLEEIMPAWDEILGLPSASPQGLPGDGVSVGAR